MKERLGNYIQEYSEKNKSMEEIPVYSVTNKEGFCTDYFGKEVASKDKSSYKLVPRGYFAYNPSRINVGSVDWQRDEEKVIVSPLYVVFGVLPKLKQQYLYYYLKSDIALQKIKVAASGSVRDNLKFSALSEFTLNIPSLRVQEQVIATMDELQKIIMLRKRQLKKLDDLIKSRFVEMFGDYNLANIQSNWEAISEIGTVVGGATPKTNIQEYWDGEYRWITPAELYEDSGYIYDSVRKLTKAGVESCSLQEMPINTVILSSRAPIGKVAIAGNTFYCNQGFKNIICKDVIIPRYLYTLLLLNKEYLNSLGRGATFKEISKSIVENIKIPVPALDLQKQFSIYIEQINKLKFNHSHFLRKIKVLNDRRFPNVKF